MAGKYKVDVNAAHEFIASVGMVRELGGTGTIRTGADAHGSTAPGVIYQADTWDFGVEALIPGNRASGTNVGVITQFHLFLDDLLPNGIGKPIFQ